MQKKFTIFEVQRAPSHLNDVPGYAGDYCCAASFYCKIVQSKRKVH